METKGRGRWREEGEKGVVCACVDMHHAHICVQAPAITQERLGVVEQVDNLGIPKKSQL